jgi:hypothetical protein
MELGIESVCGEPQHNVLLLMAALLGRSEDGSILRKAGIIGMVLADGKVKPGNLIRVQLPKEPHRYLNQV